MIAEMRLQWWRDAVEEIGEGGKVRSHEVTQPLCELIRSKEIPVTLLDQMIQGRRWDIYKDPFENQDHFDEYIDQTSGNLMWASTLALGGKPEFEEGVRSLAYGSGVASLLQAAAELESRGRIPLVNGTKSGIKSLSKQALARVYSCTQKGRDFAPALWPGYLAKPLLRQAIENPERVADGLLDVSEFTKNWRLLRRQVFGMN
jgi:phytoene synthase